LGAVGGSQSSTALLAHTHVNVLNDLGHTHNILTGADATTPNSGGVAVGGIINNGANVRVSASNNTAPMSITNATAGSGSSYTILNPAAIVNKIIFVGHG
jgi:hypothetical protein